MKCTGALSINRVAILCTAYANCTLRNTSFTKLSDLIADKAIGKEESGNKVFSIVSCIQLINSAGDMGVPDFEAKIRQIHCRRTLVF